MAADINNTTLGGRLGADPEVRNTSGGKTVTTFRLATTTGWGDHEGTLWTKVELWGDNGPKVAKFLSKGSPVSFDGSIEMEEWEDRDGNKRQSLKLKARNCYLPAKSKNDGDSADSRGAGSRGGYGGGTNNGGSSGGYGGRKSEPAPIDDDSIPF